MQRHKNKVAWCPQCDQGWVQIYKDKRTKELFVVCDECESSWEHPTDAEKNNISTLIFDTDIEIEIPTEQEVRLKKWDKYIINSY
ncbi:hypothetical protein [Priestia megaterium]|uniref:hypothetical protein n=1 Tax=Priestia megaterium TaxID=1404 RepID=UPI0023DAC41B|nr:hypothetical protein [Priestia megaterium]MDF2013857.1 hypothetical protein [Priestia megaterium]